MPVDAQIVNGRVRTVEPDGNISVNDKGNARDGGGWPNTPEGWTKGRSQSMHINDGVAKRDPALPPRAPLSAAPAASKRTAKKPLGKTLQRPL